jgi:RNA 3'-terminal phosphate cyclase (ATP)
MLRIDGSFGEGGGQILRTSLSLSMITGRPFRIENIRARRQRGGLLRQHLTAVRAAAEICDGRVQGASLGSAALTFEPGRSSPEITTSPLAPPAAEHWCCKPCCLP